MSGHPLRFGVCWYPEQWPEPRWSTDIAMMAEMGLDVVRIGEFAWSRIEPSRARFEWGWLDRAIEQLAAAGLDVVLGTPTATPPVWLTEQRPEMLTVGPDGRRRTAGSRRHTSTSSLAAREEAARIVTALVERYGTHPAVVGWQVDNEPGNHDSARCWSQEATTAFQHWLAARFGDITTLNEAWGLVFWSGEAPSFAAVRPPVPTVAAHSPSLRHAHLTFASEQATAGLAEQRDIIRAGSPGRDIITNLYLADVDIDPIAVARPNTIAALDLYPHGTSGPAEVGFLLDLARGSAMPPDAGPGRGRVWVTEAQAGPVLWTGDNPSVAPGQVALWAWQAVLHGVDTLLWFRWRSPRAGQEQHATGLLLHDGRPSPVYAEIAGFLREVRAAVPEQRTRRAARVALVHDVSDAWMIAVSTHLDAANHRTLALAAYTAAWRLGLAVDVVPPDADLRRYELVLAPGLHQVTPARLARLRAALEAGSTVVLGPRSLVRDEHAVWVEEPVPAGLSALLGARIIQQGSPAGWPRGGPPDSQVAFDDAVFDSGGWLETYALDAADTEVLARAHGGPHHGAAVVVRRGGLVAVGAAAGAVHTHLLARLTDRQVNPEHLEVVDTLAGTVRIDHRTCTLALPS